MTTEAQPATVECHTFEEWDRAITAHDRDAVSILNQLIGAFQFMDSPEGRDDDEWKAATLDRLRAQVETWAARRPEWIR